MTIIEETYFELTTTLKFVDDVRKSLVKLSRRDFVQHRSVLLVIDLMR